VPSVRSSDSQFLIRSMSVNTIHGCQGCQILKDFESKRGVVKEYCQALSSCALVNHVKE
jgi:hypothetical protein